MSKMKKINRNAFNEKLIHRYLFEKYYFAPKNIRNSLLPEKFHKYKINLIVPEKESTETGYRADLTIYFKDHEKGIPVEVKWSEENLTKENQIGYLSKNNGFIVSFRKNSKENFVSKVPHVAIDPDDFFSWMQGNTSKLTRESLIYQAQTKAFNKTQYWVVFLRGTSLQNFSKMLSFSKKSPFWAFTQNGHSLKNILDMQKGDKLLFLLGYANEGMGVSDDPNLPLEFVAWYETTIKEPYYMILNGDKGTFFEDGDLPVNKRRWPHFMDFEIKTYFESLKRINFGKRGEYSKALAESVNYGAGAPAPLLQHQWDGLTDHLRKISQ